MARVRKKKGMTEVIQHSLFDAREWRSWRIEYVSLKDSEGNKTWVAMLLNQDGEIIFETQECANKDYVRMEALRHRETMQLDETQGKEVFN